MDCIFCKIINGDIPSTKVYEDALVYAFKDINPEAPVHVLIVPRQHIDSAASIDVSHHSLIGHIHSVAIQIAQEAGIDKTGYRLLTNIGIDGGQSVQHLHYHLLGGRRLKWPPG